MNSCLGFWSVLAGALFFDYLLSDLLDCTPSHFYGYNKLDFYIFVFEFRTQLIPFFIFYSVAPPRFF